MKTQTQFLKTEKYLTLRMHSSTSEINSSKMGKNKKMVFFATQTLFLLKMFMVGEKS